MKDYLHTLVAASGSPLEGRNRVREYLQARLLQSLQEAGAMIPLAFHGGTALRFLFSLPRYSEDLDFALERGDRTYDFRSYLKRIRSNMASEGYAVSLRIKDDKPVHGAFVGFPGLLHELGLSPHPDEALSIKLEVDTHAPVGAGLATTVVRRHVILHLQHHDPASLLAGKLHAIIERPYVKGRDLYDLLWYLSDPAWPQPNLLLLNRTASAISAACCGVSERASDLISSLATRLPTVEDASQLAARSFTHALQQTGWSHGALTEETWRQTLHRRLTGLDWPRIRQDVGPFLERSAELSLLEPETFAQLLREHL